MIIFNFSCICFQKAAHPVLIYCCWFFFFHRLLSTPRKLLCSVSEWKRRSIFNIKINEQLMGLWEYRFRWFSWFFICYQCLWQARKRFQFLQFWLTKSFKILQFEIHKYVRIFVEKLPLVYSHLLLLLVS